MEQQTNHNKGFMVYEYNILHVKQEHLNLYEDCYPSFGWLIEEVEESNHSNLVTLKLKRNRRIKNKQELVALQRKCDKAIREIIKIEALKTWKALMISILIGMLGAALITGAVFSFIANVIPLFVFCAILGFLCCTIPYFMYFKISNHETAKMEELVDKQYNIIYGVCDEARLLCEERGEENNDKEDQESFR